MSLTDTFDSVKETQRKPQSALNDLHLWLAQYNGLARTLDHTPIEIDESTLVLPENLRVSEQDRQEPTSVLPTPSSRDYDPAPVSGETWDNFLEHLLDREGYRNTAYRCSEGFLTIGVGHRVLPGDGISEGDTISDERVRELLESDARNAYIAAIEQANELGINDSDFVIALGSVNFQLGTGWRNEFSQTWAHMENGNFDQAIANIENSLWSRQTPVRTADFVNAIRDAEDNQSEFEVAAIDTNFNAQAKGAPEEPQMEEQPAPPLSDPLTRPMEPVA